MKKTRQIMAILDMILSVMIIKNWPYFKTITKRWPPLLHIFAAVLFSVFCGVIMLHALGLLEDIIMAFE